MALQFTIQKKYDFISKRIRPISKKDEVNAFRNFVTTRHTNKQSLEFSKTLNDNNDPRLNEHQVSHVTLSIVFFKSKDNTKIKLCMWAIQVVRDNLEELIWMKFSKILDLCYNIKMEKT